MIVQSGPGFLLITQASKKQPSGDAKVIPRTVTDHLIACYERPHLIGQQI